jgi:hypothetical protein
MLTPPSIQHRHTLVWSQDPALARPGDEATPETIKAFEHKLAVARDTGDWAEVVKQSEKLALFHVKPLTGTNLRRLIDETSAGKYGEQSLWAMVFRVCLRSVENIPDLKVETEVGPYGEAAKADVIDALDAIHPGIVTELGSVLFQRAVAPPKKF